MGKKNQEGDAEEVEGQAALDANIATAREMAALEGHDHESAGAWLHAQEPGVFESVEHAIEHIKE